MKNQATIKIKPVNHAGDHRTGRLSPGITRRKITNRLGFGPNIADDPDKVTASWGFTVQLPGKKPVRCGIWDYNGARWSTFGPKEIFALLFPNE